MRGTPPVELRCYRARHVAAKDGRQKRIQSLNGGRVRMMNLLTILFVIGGLLLLWLNVQDWHSSQVIISEDEHVAAAERSD
jgi:hypothetical protein